MTRSVTLAELRQRALDAADMTTAAQNQWAPVSLVNFMVNDSGSELYDLLLLRWADYFLSTQTGTITTNTAVYSLPADFYKLRGLYWLDGTGFRRELTPFEECERADLYNSINSQPSKYKVEDANLVILPAPSTGGYELRYIPQYTWLNLDTDTVSMNVISGWESYIVYDVAVKLRVKGRQDANLIQATQGIRDKIAARITAAASEREAGGHHKIADTYGWSVMRRRMPRRA